MGDDVLKHVNICGDGKGGACYIISVTCLYYTLYTSILAWFVQHYVHGT